MFINSSNLTWWTRWWCWMLDVQSMRLDACVMPISWPTSRKLQSFFPLAIRFQFEFITVHSITIKLYLHFVFIAHINDESNSIFLQIMHIIRMRFMHESLIGLLNAICTTKESISLLFNPLSVSTTPTMIDFHCCLLRLTICRQWINWYFQKRFEVLLTFCQSSFRCRCLDGEMGCMSAVWQLVLRVV